jgi:hypothetical protein
MFAGWIAAPGVRGAFRGFLVDGRLIVAPEGGDIVALFAADYASIAFDDQAYAVRLAPWEGEGVVFSRLGADSTAFLRALQSARETLARQAGDVIPRYLPPLAAGARAQLAAEWLPGRLLSFERLERIAPGFERAFRDAWLASTPRAASGSALIDGVDPGDRFVGYASPAPGQDPSLWLVVRRGDTSSLELLSHEDYATYLFRSDGELPALVEGLIRLPEFSREALYLPLEQLTGERGIYAIPARDLPLLRGLREHFSGRKIHASNPSP